MSFSKLLYNRRRFIAQVYLILALQVSITFIVAKYLRENQDIYKFALKFFIPLIILPFMIILAFPYCPQYLKLGLFCVFSFILGILSLGASRYIPAELIEVSLISTVSVFVIMTILGLGLASMGIDLSFLYFTLLAVLIGIIIVRIILLFSGVESEVYKAIATFSIIIFSIFVSFDTNRMLQKEYSLDAIDTAMGFYLDIENLFSNFIEMGLNK